MTKRKTTTNATPTFDVEQAKMLRSEIGKVRCWLTGFAAGRGPDHPPVPGELSLLHVQMFLNDLIQSGK